MFFKLLGTALSFLLETLLSEDGLFTLGKAAVEVFEPNWVKYVLGL